MKPLYKARNSVIELIDDHSSMVSEAKYKTIHREKRKTLTPGQILQRLPIALTQVKTSNTSEKLLKEIRQVIYFLYRTKEITKKNINNIVSSIRYNTKWILYL